MFVCTRTDAAMLYIRVSIPSVPLELTAQPVTTTLDIHARNLSNTHTREMAMRDSGPPGTIEREHLEKLRVARRLREKDDEPGPPSFVDEPDEKCPMKFDDGWQGGQNDDGLWNWDKAMMRREGYWKSFLPADLFAMLKKYEGKLNIFQVEKLHTYALDSFMELTKPVAESASAGSGSAGKKRKGK